MRRRLLQIGVLLVTLGLLAWAVTVGLERLSAPPAAVPPAAALGFVDGRLLAGPG